MDFCKASRSQMIAIIIVRVLNVSCKSPDYPTSQKMGLLLHMSLCLLVALSVAAEPSTTTSYLAGDRRANWYYQWRNVSVCCDDLCGTACCMCTGVGEGRHGQVAFYSYLQCAVINQQHCPCVLSARGSCEAEGACPGRLSLSTDCRAVMLSPLLPASPQTPLHVFWTLFHTYSPPF